MTEIRDSYEFSVFVSNFLVNFAHEIIDEAPFHVEKKLELQA